MPFNTRNPIPSGDLRDLDDNARNIDVWVNDKTKLKHPDRVGDVRLTWHGIEQKAQLNIQQAIDAKNAAQEAAMMSGFSKYADTLAQLEAGIGTDYVEGDVVMVFQDESRGDTSSIFKIESGTAEFKLTFDKTRQDLLSFTGAISADAEWSDVPAHSDPAFDVQVQALSDRVEWLKENGGEFDFNKNYVAGTIGARLKERISVTDFPWLASKDNPDNTAAIQAALDTGLDVFIPDWMPVQDTVYLVNDGQLLESCGKFRGGLINTTNSNRLFQVGRTPDVPGKRGQFSVVRNIGFRGNATTLEGVRLIGIMDDGATGAARGVSVENIDVRDIGAGYALTVNGWCVGTKNVTLWSSLRGLQLGKEVNACHFDLTYISNMQKEGVVSVNDGGIPAASHLTSLIVQYCGQDGTTDYAIDFRRGFAFVFDSVYLEGNKVNIADFYINGAVHGTKVRGVNYQIAGSSESKDVVLIEGNAKAVEVHGVLGLQGNVKSLVRVRNGILPVVTVSGLYMANGVAADGELVDESPRRQVIRIDSAQNSFGPTRFSGLPTQNQLSFVDGSTGAIRGFFKEGRYYFGADTAGAWLDAAGKQMYAKYGAAALANFEAARYRVNGSGAANSGPLILAGTGDPNNFYVAPVGSIFLRIDGGTSTSIYVKESGTGSSGWVAK